MFSYISNIMRVSRVETAFCKMLRHIIVLLLTGSCWTELLNLHEGSNCTRKEVSGKCVSIYKCLSSYLDLQNKDPAPICSFRGKEPIICCTDCKLVNDTRKIEINSYLGIIYKTGPKAADKCFEYLDRLKYRCKHFKRAMLGRYYDSDMKCNQVDIQYYQAAYGGRDAERKEFPHMALLGYGDDITTAAWLCGGTIISESFILTAGHCLASASLGRVKYVALGILKRTDPPEMWQVYNVKRIIPHPEYKPPSKYHDIALLETDTEITFSEHVLPACLHVRGKAVESLSATGWGALGHKKQLADTLQEVTVSRFEEDECLKYYPPHRHLKNGYNHTTQMCYGDKLEPKDTCEGDSGGPLQYKSGPFYCITTVFGVTSYGRQCGISVGSGVYTRVVYYIPWIESIVWP